MLLDFLGFFVVVATKEGIFKGRWSLDLPVRGKPICVAIVVPGDAMFVLFPFMAMREGKGTTLQLSYLFISKQ